MISALRGVALSSIVRGFWFLPLATALGAWLGTHILLAMPPEPFLLILAGVILLYLNLDRFGRGRSALVERLRMPFGAAFGFVAGVCEAVANVAGPILLIYFMLLGLAPAQMVQTLNLCFSLGKGAQTATWAMSGEISPRGWLLIGALTVPSVAALFAGMRVRNRIDAPTYRRWLRGALWIMAALLLLQFSTRVLASEEARVFGLRGGLVACDRAGRRSRGARAGARRRGRRQGAQSGGRHAAAPRGGKGDALPRRVAARARRRSQCALQERRDAAATSPRWTRTASVAELLLDAGADPARRTTTANRS